MRPSFAGNGSTFGNDGNDGVSRARFVHRLVAD